MSDPTFHWVTVTIQAIGLIVVVFGGGKFIGEMRQMIKQLFDNDKELKAALNAHKVSDEENFKEINSQINQVNINLARQYPIPSRFKNRD